LTLIFAFLIGLFAGLRSLMAPAITSWAVYLGWLKIDSPFSLIGSLPAVVILTLFAVGELVADKLPGTPNRTGALGLSARFVSGAVTGACVALAGGQTAIAGALCGAIGGIVGAFAGFQVRTGLVKALGTRDVYVAVVEDLVAIAGGLLIVSRF
jgi:uncharacterized membrane protein